MRVRITRPSDGTVDGVPLSIFLVGRIYDVPASLASYLISLQAAEPLMDADVSSVTPGGPNRTSDPNSQA